MDNLLTILKCKLHNVRVTNTNIDYEGSIVVDGDYMNEIGLLPYERVEVYNITNGERFVTYIIKGEKGKKEISVQGAAARKAQKGDRLIICAFITTANPEKIEQKIKIFK